MLFWPLPLSLVSSNFIYENESKCTVHYVGRISLGEVTGIPAFEHLIQFGINMTNKWSMSMSLEGNFHVDS